jgi:hypothetical protein
MAHMNRRQFIRHGLTALVLATPIGKWVYDLWQSKKQIPVHFGGGTVRLPDGALYSEGKLRLRGVVHIDDGMFYAPYVPFKADDLIYDPALFQPRRGMLTRFKNLQ